VSEVFRTISLKAKFDLVHGLRIFHAAFVRIGEYFSGKSSRPSRMLPREGDSLNKNHLGELLGPESWQSLSFASSCKEFPRIYPNISMS